MRFYAVCVSFSLRVVVCATCVALAFVLLCVLDFQCGKEGRALDTWTYFLIAVAAAVAAVAVRERQARSRSTLVTTKSAKQIKRSPINCQGLLVLLAIGSLAYYHAAMLLCETSPLC